MATVAREWITAEQYWKMPDHGQRTELVAKFAGTPVTIHRYVADCDAAVKRAQDAGATVIMPAQDMFWGDRYGVVTDPYGHNWSFATHLKDLTPDEMRAAMKDAFAQGP